MKKTMFVLSLLAAVFAGCSNDMENEGPAGKAGVMLNLSSDLSYSRAFDESEYKNTANYQVRFVKTESDEAVYEGKYSDMPLTTYQVEPGVSYTITAHYGEDVVVGYDKLYVKGAQTFAVVEGDTKKVNITCTPANARLKLVYSDDFTTYYSDCKVSVKTAFMDQAWAMGIADKGKELFLKTGDEGTKAVIQLQLIGKDGNPVEVGMETSRELNLQPRDSYTLTVKPDVTEVEGGKIGISVTIDNEVKDENIHIDVPGNLM